MRGRPVIVQIQSWGDEGTDYTNDFDDGHYVFVIGIYILNIHELSEI